MTRTSYLDAMLYPLSCLALAEREFIELCSVARVARDNGVEVTISPKPDAPPEIADEFLNFVLCAALEQHLSS
jgi:hypothetical protein